MSCKVQEGKNAQRDSSGTGDEQKMECCRPALPASFQYAEELKLALPYLAVCHACKM